MCAGSNEATFVVDTSTVDVGTATAITLGSDRMPFIVHFDNINDAVRMIHCSNVFCTPNARRH